MVIGILFFPRWNGKAESGQHEGLVGEIKMCWAKPCCAKFYRQKQGLSKVAVAVWLFHLEISWGPSTHLAAGCVCRGRGGGGGGLTNGSPPPTHHLPSDLHIGDWSNWAQTALYTDNSRHCDDPLVDAARQLPRETFQQTGAHVTGLEDRHQCFEERPRAVD